jgi:AcrR family transcriptional regulator
VRKLAELKKETSERASKNAARYDKFSDRIKALIKQFSAGLIDATKVLDETEVIARDVLAEDDAHVGSGLNERAYGIAAILERFQVVAAEGDSPAYAGNAQPLSPLRQAAADIDGLYASDVSAPTYWQDKTELKKELRGQVRRIIQALGLDGWQKQVPLEVEHYAVLYYSKP